MRTVETHVFKFDELSEAAKEKARVWYRSGALDYEWWDCTVEDAKTIGALMGFDIDKVYFSGFCSQGDGACFVGGMEYAKGCAKAVKDYAPQDVELHRIASAWQALQARHFYKLTARVTKTDHRYSHENTVSFDVYRDGDYAMADAEYAVKEIGRDFMRWIYRQLEKEYEYLNSDESVDETIRANEYEFTENGSIF